VGIAIQDLVEKEESAKKEHHPYTGRVPERESVYLLQAVFHCERADVDVQHTKDDADQANPVLLQPRRKEVDLTRAFLDLLDKFLVRVH
jgi:hypothetical protein